jgi:hypothetical protein
MHIHIPRMVPEPHDEGLLAGPGEERVRALGVVGRVLSFFRPDFAALCPDLVREAQMTVSRGR